MQDLAGLPDNARSRLEALADLDRLTSDVAQASVMIDQQFDSVLAVAEAPRERFVHDANRRCINQVGLGEIASAQQALSDRCKISG